MKRWDRGCSNYKTNEGYKESFEELDKIALKPRILTNAEYLQQMIYYEKEKIEKDI